MPYSWLLRSSVLSIFFVAIHGQCTTCGDCDADASACNSDPACRVLVAGAIAEGEPPQICVEIGTCESNCALCSNADCEAASRARCFISGATNTCVGGDCQLSCTECTLGDGTDCDTSEAEPNGCVFDVEGAEECSPRPTDEPTTADPTTAAPTTSAPTTASPTTLAPTTASPTTASPTTASPTTPAPTTATPTTRAPTTGQPTTMFPTDADDEPNSTEVDDCPECAYSVTVTYIGNVSLESCVTPSPTPQKSYWEKKETTQKKKKKSSKKKKRRRRQRRRRLGGGGGWKRDKEWDEEDDEPTPAPTPWIVDRDCIDRTNSRRRRRLKTWGYAADDRDDDGCKKKTKKTTTTPAPTTVDTEFEEWYREKCKLSSDAGAAGWDEYFGDTAYGESTSSLSGVGANVYLRYATYANIEYGADVFLATVCVTYDIANVVDSENDETDECPDPAAVSSIFLGLCENNATDFNWWTVTVEELSSLIVSVDADGGEIESAEGGSYQGQLGILIELSANNSATSIELCLGNVTVDDDFNDARESLETGYGVVMTGDNEVCPVDGLPCLNFFFDVPCPPNNTVVNSSEAVLNDDETVGADNAVSNGVSIFETPLVALENIDPYVRYSLLAVLVTFVVLTCIGCYICVVKRGERAHDGEKLVASDNETHVQLAQVPDDRDSQRFLQNTSTLDEENDDDHNFYDAQDLKSMATR